MPSHNNDSNINYENQNVTIYNNNISPPIKYPESIVLDECTMNSKQNDNSGKLEKYIMDIIRKYRCNSVLDLQGRIISLQQWREIENYILNTDWLPPIKHIDLRGTNIPKENIHSDLLPYVII